MVILPNQTWSVTGERNNKGSLLFAKNPYDVIRVDLANSQPSAIYILLLKNTKHMGLTIHENVQTSSLNYSHGGPGVGGVSPVSKRQLVVLCHGITSRDNVRGRQSYEHDMSSNSKLT